METDSFPTPFYNMNQLTVKISNKVMSWVFQYGHDFNFFKKNILKWALKDFEFTDENPDFLIGVFIKENSTFEYIESFKSQKFLLSGEAHTRHPVLDNCYSFVQDSRPNEFDPYIRYAPTLTCWCPPFEKKSSTINILSTLKNPINLISAIDSGQYDWRSKLIRDLSLKFENKIDLYGGIGKSLGGYHHNTSTQFLNEKYLGLWSYLFSVSIENKTAAYSKEDYITEKVTDPIMCETLPICQSAPNLSDYFIDGSYITLEDFLKLDLKNLTSEYLKRRPAILKQKEFLRNTLNVFSYFHKLTDDLSLLDKLRPITLK